ncbi:MAG: TetR family transcriptional regulator, partial [Clostridiaceae bacterium]|nr:TetR family transcriptional regulator [Clostridiaceae bacterium]
MSNLTKRQLSVSLQKLLVQNQLDKITIQDLVNEAQVSRKTFYYHFQDIYDLLEWTLVDEGKKLLTERQGEDGWKN